METSVTSIDELTFLIRVMPSLRRVTYVAHYHILFLLVTFSPVYITPFLRGS
jgi:hypothetical protein